MSILSSVEGHQGCLCVLLQMAEQNPMKMLNNYRSLQWGVSAHALQTLKKYLVIAAFPKPDLLDMAT